MTERQLKQLRERMGLSAHALEGQPVALDAGHCRTTLMTRMCR